MPEQKPVIQIYRRPKYFLLIATAGFLLPPTILFYGIVSAQGFTTQTSVLLGVLWVMMLAASIPLVIDYRRYRVQLTSDDLIIHSWTRSQSIALPEIHTLDYEPVKIVLKNSNGKKLDEISTILQGMTQLHEQLKSICDRNNAQLD